MFRDREEAGEKLGDMLVHYRGQNAVVLALPRGGVVLGRVIAHHLHLPLDIVVTRKIGHPTSPEYAIGAVDEQGTTILNDAEGKTVDQAWLKEEVLRQQQEAQRRSNLYRKGKNLINLVRKVAIIVDDGIATGLTMRLAVRSVKIREPSKIVVAVPVAPAGSLRALRSEGADEVIVLEQPDEFLGAVGAHFEEFPQVDDAEVMRLMAKQ